MGDEFKKVVLMISIPGSDNDFLLSLPTLKAYMIGFPNVNSKYEFVIIDFKNSDTLEYIRSIIQQTKYNILCLSCYTWNKDKIFGLLDLDAEKIIVGGPQIGTDKIDGNIYYVSNEGEEKLYTILMEEESPQKSLYERASPYLSGCVNKDTLLRKGMRFNIETSRGCRFRCSYCKYHTNRPLVTYRNLDDVIHELMYVESLGLKTGRFVDSDFANNITRSTELLNKMVNIHLKLGMEININFITEKFIDALKKYIDAGNDVITGIGIQSANIDSLRCVNRYRDIATETINYKRLSEIGAMIRIDFIMGLPYETFNTYSNTIELICSMLRYNKSFPDLCRLYLISGTELERKANTYNLKCDEIGLIISTDHMKQSELDYFDAINGVVNRIFHPTDIDNNLFDLRKSFFDCVDRNNVSNLLVLEAIRVKYNIHKNTNDYFYRNVIKDIDYTDLIKYLGDLNFDKNITNSTAIQYYV